MRRFMIWTLTTATLAASTGASAQAAAEAALSEQLEQQEQRIRVLERKLEIQEDAAKTAASSTPVVKASPKGFALQSADAANQIKLRGVVHIDGRYLVDDAGFPATDRTGGTDTWQLTRVRPIIEGTLSNLIDFRFTPDFGQGRTVIQDAFVTARFAPVLRVTAGKFKAPFGLERLQSANDIRFVARAYPTSLSPNRDIGLALEGDLFDGRLSYAAAYANGVIDGGSSEATADVDVDDDQDLIVRLFSHPFAALDAFALRGLGFGIAASYIEQVGTVAQPLLPSFRTPPQQTFFRYRTGATATISNGERFRWSPQFYYYVGSLGLLGEYVHVSTDVARTTTAGTHTGKIDNAAWQFAASWFLTGEEAANRGYTPLSTFNPGVSLGAFELTARYHELDIDDDAFVGGTDSFADPNLSASKASTAEVGINWYVNQNLKWVLNYGITRFEGGVPTGDRDDEKFLLMRFALGF